MEDMAIQVSEDITPSLHSSGIHLQNPVQHTDDCP